MPQRALGLGNFVLVVGELLVISDLMFHSRIESAARAAGADLVRVDSPAQVPADVDLVLVDWSAREPDWTDPLRGLRAGGVRLILLPAVVGVRSARGDARRSATRRGPPQYGDMMGGSGSGTEMRVPMLATCPETRSPATRRPSSIDPTYPMLRGRPPPVQGEPQ